MKYLSIFLLLSIVGFASLPYADAASIKDYRSDCGCSGTKSGSANQKNRCKRSKKHHNRHKKHHDKCVELSKQIAQTTKKIQILQNEAKKCKTLECFDTVTPAIEIELRVLNKLVKELEDLGCIKEQPIHSNSEVTLHLIKDVEKRIEIVKVKQKAACFQPSSPRCIKITADLFILYQEHILLVQKYLNEVGEEIRRRIK